MSKTVNVEANNPQWTNTGVSVNSGENVKIKASGQFHVQHQSRPIGPEGSGGEAESYSNFIARGLTKHALIGKIGSGDPFLVGNEVEHTAQTDGELKLIINENSNMFGDNKGSINVTIETVTIETGDGDFPLRAGFEFKPDNSNHLYNSNRSHFLVFQTDGNLVVYKGDTIDPQYSTWAFNNQPTNQLTWPNPIKSIKNVTFGTNGNLVATDSDGNLVWESKTDGHPKAQLEMTGDGKLIITDGGQTIWPS